MAGLKRTRTQVDADDTSAAKRHAAMTVAKRRTDGNAPHAKRTKTGAANHAKYQPKKFSLNPLKARIRDLRRQLTRNAADMPANIRVDKERELQACEHELSVAEAERIKQDMIPRYHKVRFFERQKATRFLKKAVKHLNDNSDPDKHADLEREKHVAEVDLNYTLYYPLIRPYVSLYASTGANSKEYGSSNTARTGGDKEMWDIVEKKMQDNGLEALRNGLEWKQGVVSEDASAAPVAAPVDKKAAKAAKAPTAAKSSTRGSKPTSTAAQEEESGDDSDGGFFE